MDQYDVLDLLIGGARGARPSVGAPALPGAGSERGRGIAPEVQYIACSGRYARSEMNCARAYIASDRMTVPKVRASAPVLDSAAMRLFGKKVRPEAETIVGADPVALESTMEYSGSHGGPRGHPLWQHGEGPLLGLWFQALNRPSLARARPCEEQRQGRHRQTERRQACSRFIPTAW